jgi:hypothetical protein
MVSGIQRNTPLSFASYILETKEASMLRYALAALLAVVVSDPSFADQTYQLNFTAKVTDVSGNIAYDSIGRMYDLAPPPYESFRGEASYTVDDTRHVRSFSMSTDSGILVALGHFFGLDAHATLVDPSNPYGGLEGLAYSNFDLGDVIGYASSRAKIQLLPYDLIERFEFNLKVNMPGESYIDLTLLHASRHVGNRTFREQISLTSVSPVPEPSALLLTVLGLGGMVVSVVSRRRRRRAGAGS